ncbi:MAG: diguanylate cyclase [Burkholderiales bacterium]
MLRRLTGWTGPMGVRTHLLLLVMALGVPFLVYMAASLVVNLDTERDHARREVRAAALLAAARLDEQLGRLTLLLGTLGQSVGPVVHEPQRVDALLRELPPEVRAQIYNLSVWTAEGRYVASLVPAVGVRMPSVADKPYFQEIVRKGGLVVVSPVASSVSGEPLVGLATPILHGGQLIGVMAIAVRVDQLYRLLGTEDSLPTGALVTVLDADGRVITRSHDAASWVGRRLIDDPAELAKLRQRVAGAAERGDETGTLRLFGYAPMKAVPWTVFVGVPSDDAIAPAMARLQRSLVFGVAMLGVGLLLAVWAAERVARPLRLLSERAVRVGRGEPVDRRPLHGVSEVAFLAATLNQANEALQQRTQALQASRALLRKVTDQVPAQLALLDKDERFLFLNESFRARLDVDPQTLVGRSVAEAYGEEVYAEVRHHFQAAWAGQPTLYQRRLLQGDRERWVEVTLAPCFDPEGPDPRRVVELCAMVIDVTERHLAQERLARSEERLSLALEGSELALFDWDIPAGRFYMSAQGAVHRGGAPCEQVTTSREQLALVHPDDTDRLMGDLLQTLSGKTDTYEIEFRGRRLDGSWVWLRRHGRVFERDANGNAVRLAGIEIDINERKAAEERLRLLAETDPLTGLPNRALFVVRLEQAVQRARQRGRPMAVLFLDIDHFKQVNDTRGHDAGDQLLKTFAQRLVEGVRTSDTVARLGGDEFTVILEDLGRPDDALSVAQSLVEAARQPVMADGLELRFTTSVGVAVWTQGELDGPALLRQADAALYEAKRLGRDRCEVVGLGEPSGADVST